MSSIQPALRFQRAARRAALVATASLIAIVAGASLASAQDTTSTPKPVPAAPVKDSSVTSKETARPAATPARDTVASPAAGAPTTPAPATPAPATPQVAQPSVLIPITKDATPTAGAARDSAGASAVPTPASPAAATASTVTPAGAPAGAPPANPAPAAGKDSALASPAGAARALVPPVKADSSAALAKARPSSPTTAAPVAEAAEAAPDSAANLANAYVQRAVTLHEQGKDEAALAEYRRGIAHDPLDSDTWYGLATLLHELGRDKQAIETYTLSLSAIEHAPELRLPFAELLMMNHRKPEAIKVLQRGIELDPDASADMKEMLGNVLVGVLDDSMTVAGSSTPSGTGTAASPTAGTSGSTTAKAATARQRTKLSATKRKKPLCKLFCPGSVDPLAPKPK